MKYSASLIIVIALLIQGCSQKRSQVSNQEENPEAVTEQQTPANLPETTSTADTVAGAKFLTREVFLRDIWNYNDFPNEWKYQGSKPAIIDFYADWCAPCRIASPILEKVAVEYAGRLNVYKINTEKEQELASVFGIQSIPAFLYIPLTGKPVMMAGIGRTEDATRQMFIDNISKYLLTEEK